MMRINILVEGQSEEEFVKRLLIDHLSLREIYPNVQRVVTSRDKRSGITFKGGLSNYVKVKNHLLQWMKEDQNKDVRFSTMFDLFRLPNDFPGYAVAKMKQDKYEQVEELESAFETDISDDRLIPYIQLHEFEALILAQPEKFENYFLDRQTEIMRLKARAAAFGSPELVNDDLPPSKLIEEFFPNYSKVKPAASVAIAEAIGLLTIRQSCRHFAKWLSRLESLVSN